MSNSEEPDSEEKPLSFEPAIASLDALVRKMESGELTLEQSLAAFEEGIRLTGQCQRALDHAEQRVQQLLGSGADLQTQPFNPEEDPIS